MALGERDAPVAGSPGGDHADNAVRIVEWAPGRAISAAVLGAVAWAVLASGDVASLIVGVPSIALAALIAARVGRAEGWKSTAGSARPAALPAFLLRLIIDVFASAASLTVQMFRPRLDIDPGLVDYRLSLAAPEARAAFMNSVTLTPGTLSGPLDGQILTVHALDRRHDVKGDLRALEARIAALFGEQGQGAT